MTSISIKERMTYDIGRQLSGSHTVNIFAKQNWYQILPCQTQDDDIYASGSIHPDTADMFGVYRVSSDGMSVWLADADTLPDALRYVQEIICLPQ